MLTLCDKYDRSPMVVNTDTWARTSSSTAVPPTVYSHVLSTGPLASRLRVGYPFTGLTRWVRPRTLSVGALMGLLQRQAGYPHRRSDAYGEARPSDLPGIDSLSLIRVGYTVLVR